MRRLAVVMAGGSGERFWPLSRKERPKQLLRLTSAKETLLEEAVNRIAPLVGSRSVLIATAEHLREPILAAELVPEEDVIAEPAKRNTLGALAYLAATLIARHPNDWEDISAAVLTADHKIDDPEAFRRTVREALEVAESMDALVTLGIAPTRPETGYGYIELGPELPDRPGTHESAGFREKPDGGLAEEFLRRGTFLWNSGMFFWTLRAFMGEMQRAAPDVAERIRAMAAALAGDDHRTVVATFESMPNISIDYALLEKSERVYVVEAQFGWDDVGAWDALERSLGPNREDNVVVGHAITLDTARSIVVNEEDGRIVCLLGVSDLVVVATPDAVLVCRKDQAQRVKEIVARLPGTSFL